MPGWGRMWLKTTFTSRSRGGEASALEEERQRHALAQEEVDRRLLLSPDGEHALPARMEVGVVDDRVALDGCAPEALDLHGVRVADRKRNLAVVLDVLELAREEHAG